jgi:hypothetical protein
VFLRADAPGQETTQTLGIVGSREAGPRDSQMKPLEQVLAENAIRGGGA